MIITLEELKSLIESRGYPVYEVGGAVRDKLLQKPVSDIDLATSMPVELLLSMCKEMHISCQVALDKTETKVLIVSGYEVAEFRKDVYSDGKFEKAIRATIEEDALRRDFTVNALYERNGEVIDLMGGIEDMKNKLIRTCGEPLDRFQEDASRILRAAYLAAKLDFSIHPSIIDCVQSNKHLLNNIHPSLYGKIITKSIQSGSFHSFILNLEQMGIVFDVFRQCKYQENSPQNPKYHHLDVWSHTKLVVKHAETRRPKDVFYILSAFCHDIAKSLPEIRTIRNGHPSDLNHEEYGALIAKQFVQSLGLGLKNATYVQNMVLFHGMSIVPTERSTRRFLLKLKESFKSKEEMHAFILDLFDLMEDDALSFAPDFSIKTLAHLHELKPVLLLSLDKYFFYPKDFPFDGKFIIANSTLKGPAIHAYYESMIREAIVDVDKLIKRMKSVVT